MMILTQISRKMKECLNEEAEKAAEAVGLIQRKGKVTGPNLCQTVVFGWWQNPEATLEELTQVGKSVGLSMTPQGLDQRWTEGIAAYLKLILRQLVQRKLEEVGVELELMSQFSHVYVEDSSVVTLPEEVASVWQGLGGKGPVSSVKLQTRLDLKTGCMDGPHLVDGKTHDRVAAKQAHAEVERDSLHLRDLGYWKVEEWSMAVERGYHLLSRLKASTHFWQDNQVWSCGQWCAACSEREFDVEILLGSKAKIPVRLIGKRADKAVANERRRKLKRKSKERGKTVSKERLALCDWTLIVTTLPPERLTARGAFIWLGVRWQIELLFKLWKSVGKIDKSRSQKPWRILCELYAKLIGMVLMQWLFSPTIWRFPDRSWTKAARTIRMHVIRIATAMSSSIELTLVLHDICDILASGCRINPSRKHPRTYQKLRSVEPVIA